MTMAGRRASGKVVDLATARSGIIRRGGRRMRGVIVLMMAAGLAGCATAQMAEYRDPKTGVSYFCNRQIAAGIIPTVLSNNAYADCKNLFEDRGFVRQGDPLLNQPTA